ncbi:hypothetical protein OM409_12425 [Serratia bockelmannii]|uniref:hypothetical protein n=1 Tax=Serratia TaxID=613 RepID=UPI0022400199|nr:hypothetical protein [Serratia bockelmannii]MCW7646182.1 hypothetical protein [Serratia bockelmannii]MCW7655967.1 hypothetical protein [Serratia bockelmannii]MCW7675752.1 hypothetical protein [Serratia bockelmannii]MCW7680530.1 hypothetical protein [Serratia bockelmannii]MCW7685306.1 hypothetical protein [Serratia bockelmannii]
MQNLRRVGISLFALLLAGCVSQRYVGVRVSATEPMSVTHIWVNEKAVVMVQERE